MLGTPQRPRAVEATRNISIVGNQDILLKSTSIQSDKQQQPANKTIIDHYLRRLIMMISAKHIFRIKIDQGIILVDYATDKRLQRYLRNHEQLKNQLRARINRPQQRDRNKTLPKKRKFQTQRRTNLIRKRWKNSLTSHRNEKRSISSKDCHQPLEVMRRTI